MRHVTLRPGADAEGFRRAVRALVAAGVAPQDVAWSVESMPALLGDALDGPPGQADASPLSLPRSLADVIGLVVCHRDPQRYALLYTLVWRVLHGEPALLSIRSDRLVHRIDMLRRAIRRDLHKMHAFLRFREVPGRPGNFAAWFEPEHFIVAATAQFFVDRFTGFAWSILTPAGSLHWDRVRLTHGPAATRTEAPQSDAFEAGWCGYYESTFNPARVNPTAMRAEMAKKYWRNMPEAAQIPDLVRTAQARTEAMIARHVAGSAKRNPDKAVAAMMGGLRGRPAG